LFSEELALHRQRGPSRRLGSHPESLQIKKRHDNMKKKKEMYTESQDHQFHPWKYVNLVNTWYHLGLGPLRFASFQVPTKMPRGAHMIVSYQKERQ
jgi:hypothetical protein